MQKTYEDKVVSRQKRNVHVAELFRVLGGGWKVANPKSVSLSAHTAVKKVPLIPSLVEIGEGIFYEIFMHVRMLALENSVALAICSNVLSFWLR